ncbi:hypothetical protein [Actinoplanes regularis]|nr:hypothetical protein [Actinoplanes regularis]
MVLQPVAGGPARELGIGATGLAFAPDGRSVLVTTLFGGFHRFKVG